MGVCFVYSYVGTIMVALYIATYPSLFAVIKVIHVSNDKRYLRMVPDDDDDLTQYTGGRVLLDVPSDLLQDTSK